jgi:hypothetical protein
VRIQVWDDIGKRKWEGVKLLKLRHAAVIATALVIVAGAALISPLFFRHYESNELKPKVMLSFSILPGADVLTWCQDLASLLGAHKIGASVFVVGEVAEQSPQCLSYFSNQVDIGSQTYSNKDLTTIADYSIKLQEVQQGKTAIDKAGNLYSRIFRAPFGDTDPDIYSILSRSDIQADFSYDQQYNVFRQDQFVRCDANVFNGDDSSRKISLNLFDLVKPNIIFFDNSHPISAVKGFLAKIKTDRIDFVNASELAGYSLTSRGVGNGNGRAASN